MIVINTTTNGATTRWSRVNVPRPDANHLDYDILQPIFTRIRSVPTVGALRSMGCHGAGVTRSLRHLAGNQRAYGLSGLLMGSPIFFF